MSYVARHKSDARSGAPSSVTLVWIPIPRTQSSALHAYWVPLMCFGYSFEMCPENNIWRIVCVDDSSNDDSPLAGDISGGVIPLLTRMARDSLKTRRADRQVYITLFFENVCAYQGG